MLPDISYAYEEKIPCQPLTALIGLNSKDTHLLAGLSEQARAIAPLFGRELTARIQELIDLNSGTPVSSADIQLYLQDWFLQLFQCREEKYIGFHEYFVRIPLNLIFTGIDVVLAYGEKITQHSFHPQMALRAFHKALALKIASEQLQSQVDEAQHFYEMMLLD